MIKARIYVTLKPGVLDPQGDAVRKSAHVLGYRQVEDIRIGKFIELNWEGDDPAAALEHIAKLSDQLLANPVIEDYRVELVEGA
ncbi:MAG: phosphoribosylformylglycinamidine synthase subunit PurS [Syntrophomonadaceae bacterium]|nr:phosphoribosylformylglycinamidine synthase subunit PurS [Syntrophomonadaceae bacterium]